MTGRPGWQRDAECARRGLDPELFFPAAGAPFDPRVFSACAACRVRMTCLRAGMAEEEAAEKIGGRVRRYGIRGGLLPRQRSMLAAGRPVRLTAPTADRNKQRRKTA